MIQTLIGSGALLDEVPMDGRNFVHELCRHGRVDIFGTIVMMLEERNLRHLLTARTVGG